MTNLDERYGRKTRSKTPVILLASSLLLAFLIWAIWANFAPRPSATAQVTFTNTLSSDEITAHIVVSKANTVCSFKAMSEGYAIVGYKTVSSSEAEYDLSIRTTSRAIDILVDVCNVK